MKKAWLLLFIALTQTQRPRVRRLGSRLTRRMLRPGKELVLDMVDHAWNSYMENAFPMDELKPMSCKGTKTYGRYSLTYLDALDAHVVFGNSSRFIEAAHWICNDFSLDIDENVSVFETTIRILGALVSGHVLANDPEVGLELELNGCLLDLAVELAGRLLPAYDTKTGIPYGTVNLRHGVPEGETPVVCTACAGTALLEMGTVSRLTGNMTFERAAKRAAVALFKRRSGKGLYGSHIDAQTGKWTAFDAGVGNYIDSFPEYLLKGYILLGDMDLLVMFEDFYNAASRFLSDGFWFYRADMNTGNRYMKECYESFAGFWAGVLLTYGDVDQSANFLGAMMGVRDEFNFVPEAYDCIKRQPMLNREGYPLRPELAESLYYAWRSTQDPKYAQAVWKFARAINNTSRLECGFAAIKDIRTQKLDDRMDSFFISETLKYMYLVFDWANPFNEMNIVFTTEGHILPINYVREVQQYRSHGPAWVEGIGNWFPDDEQRFQDVLVEFAVPRDSHAPLRRFYEDLRNRHHLQNNQCPNRQELQHYLDQMQYDRGPVQYCDNPHSPPQAAPEPFTYACTDLLCPGFKAPSPPPPPDPPDEKDGSMFTFTLNGETVGAGGSIDFSKLFGQLGQQLMDTLQGGEPEILPNVPPNFEGVLQGGGEGVT